MKLGHTGLADSHSQLIILISSNLRNSLKKFIHLIIC